MSDSMVPHDRGNGTGMAGMGSELRTVRPDETDAVRTAEDGGLAICRGGCVCCGHGRGVGANELPAAGRSWRYAETTRHGPACVGSEPGTPVPDSLASLAASPMSLYPSVEPDTDICESTHSNWSSLSCSDVVAVNRGFPSPTIGRQGGFSGRRVPNRSGPPSLPCQPISLLFSSAPYHLTQP